MRCSYNVHTGWQTNNKSVTKMKENKVLALDENMYFMYKRVASNAIHISCKLVHGISPYPLRDRCRIGQITFSTACRIFV